MMLVALITAKRKTQMVINIGVARLPQLTIEVHVKGTHLRARVSRPRLGQHIDSKFASKTRLVFDWNWLGNLGHIFWGPKSWIAP